MSDDRVQYKFMIPVALKEQLEALAKENRRSLSAEIIERLERSLPAPISDTEAMLEIARVRLLSAEGDAAQIQKRVQQAKAEFEYWLSQFENESHSDPGAPE